MKEYKNELGYDILQEPQLEIQYLQESPVKPIQEKKTLKVLSLFFWVWWYGLGV